MLFSFPSTVAMVQRIFFISYSHPLGHKCGVKLNKKKQNRRLTMSCEKRNRKSSSSLFIIKVFYNIVKIYFITVGNIHYLLIN